MSESLVLAELRLMRCYSSYILGNQRLGDIAVEETLERLSPLNTPVSRLDLYKELHVVAFESQLAVSVVPASGLHARFQRLTHHQRQIASLRTAAAFSYADIAVIMGLPEKTVRRGYCEALLMLRDKPAAVLIIEDEVFIALDLQEIVESLGFPVAGIAKNRAEALKIAGLANPRLILADYRLRGDTGVDVVKAIREQMDAQVIYVTSHPDEAAATRDCEDDLVIAKPFNPRALAAAVQTQLAA